MMYKLNIPERLPGLNEYTNAQRSNAYKGATLKKKWQKVISGYIAEQIPNVHIHGKVDMTFIWHEIPRRRDKDNISSVGHKYILDALVQSKVIVNDSWEYVGDFKDIFVKAKKPLIEVIITEREDNR